MSANTTQRSSPSGPDACEKLQFVQPPFTVGTANVSLFTVALTPVRTTDVVRAINADLPNGVLGGNARVVSANVIEIDLCNPTAAQVVVPTTTYTVEIGKYAFTT